MEIRHVHHYILFMFPTLLFILAFYTQFANAFQRRVNHEQQISLDVFGKPQIFGYEYEEALQGDPNVRVKRQNTAVPTSQTAPPQEEVQTTFPPSISTEVDESDNVTIPSSVPPTSSSTTEKTSTTTTTEATTPSTTTTTEEPPQPIPAGEGQTTKGYFCLCDYQVRVCDMNCCCDPDCSDIEKSVFQRCDEDSMIYDPSIKRNKERSCYKSFIMYRENIPYRIDRTDKSMFCVVKENVRQAREFSSTDMSRISKRISHGKINIRPKYTWDSLHAESKQTMLNYDEPYKYGSAIWGIRSEIENGEEVGTQEVMFRLPASFHTDMCSVLEPVKYLEDSLSRCVRPMYDIGSQCENLLELNANYYIKDLLVILNPIALKENSTDFVKQQIVPVKWCYNKMDDCSKELSLESLDSIGSGDDSEFPPPEYEGLGLITTKRCRNVLSQLNLTFVHEGIKGITKILARALLKDVPLGQKEIVQEFKTEFIWSNAAASKLSDDGVRNDTNTSAVEDLLHLRKLPRSGNPGYIVGKPLILGRKMTRRISNVNNTDGKNKFLEQMHVLPDVSRWLHIQGAGDCPMSHEEIRDYPRHPILFGYDHVSSCKLPLKDFHHCGELQRHIASVIFGLTGEISAKEFTLSPLYVAGYGSPDAFPSDWVPLTFVGISSLTQEPYQFSPASIFSAGSNSIKNGCNGITTSVHITVSYAYVGPVDAPQAKITGIFYEPEQPILIPDSADENRIKNIPITTIVSFLDVTGKPTTRVATFPVVSVQLPADFFYPFSSSTSGPSSGAKKSAMIDYYSLSSSLAFIIIIFGTFIL